MRGRLHGRVAIITGAGAGIGAATATLFAREGASLVLVDASVEALGQTATALRADVPDARVEHVVTDIAEPTGAAAAVRRAIESYGRLDVLVNNAAMRIAATLEDATPEQWQAILGVNLVGTAAFCRASLPALRAAGRGAIVNVSSCYAVTGRQAMGLYDATKAAMLALTRTLAHEEAAHGIRVNAVCPGSTLTDFHLRKAQRLGNSVEVLRTERHDTSLLGRWAEPAEIAAPILWLASEEASFITGTTLMVDGGLHTM